SISRMVAGVDILAFRPDDELRKLAALSHELGLNDVITGGGADAVLAALTETENGRTWLAAFEAAKDPWFNYFAEYGFTHDQETWASDLSIPLQGIARYAVKIAAGEDISRPIERL